VNEHIQAKSKWNMNQFMLCYISTTAGKFYTSRCMKVVEVVLGCSGYKVVETFVVHSLHIGHPVLLLAPNLTPHGVQEL
jgi:hypothetical protein